MSVTQLGIIIVARMSMNMMSRPMKRMRAKA